MRNILKFGIISFAFSFGLVLATADTANAQNRREARREYRDEVRGARREYKGEVRESRRDYRDDVRSGQNRRDARREYRGEVRSSRRDYRDDVRESRRDYRNDVRGYRNGRGLRRGWTIGRGNAWGRPDNRTRTSTRYYYRNGRLYRRY